MLFSEVYGAYYQTVAEILKYAVKGELTEETLRKIVEEKGLGESGLTIPQALKGEKWQLLKGHETPLRKVPRLPLTTLQKRWLKAITLDERFTLFGVEIGGLEGIEPLFTPADLYYYDRYADGDPYADEGYRERFRYILSAIEGKQPLRLKVENRQGRTQLINVFPQGLEYSEKDDKFRLRTSGCRYWKTVKLSSIRSCKSYTGEVNPLSAPTKKSAVTLSLFDGRNTLERAMLHFAHFEKSVEKQGENTFLVKLIYDCEDETELLIRILSFGPFVKVVEPQSFVEKIKERLKKQKRCELN